MSNQLPLILLQGSKDRIGKDASQLLNPADRASWILEKIAYARLDREKKHNYNQVWAQDMINKVLKLSMSTVAYHGAGLWLVEPGVLGP